MAPTTGLCQADPCLIQDLLDSGYLFSNQSISSRHLHSAYLAKMRRQARDLRDNPEDVATEPLPKI